MVVPGLRTYDLVLEDGLSDRSSDGVLPKWRVISKTQGIDRFVKASTCASLILEENPSSNEDFYYDSYAEVVSSKLAIMIGMKAVDYELCNIHLYIKADRRYIDIIGCDSENFNKNNYKQISIPSIIGEDGAKSIRNTGTIGYNRLIDTFKNVEGFKKYIDDMILLDGMILNTDRHLRNIGLLRKENGEFEVTPIFDNGDAFLSSKWITEDTEFYPEMVEGLMCKPFNTEFNEQLKLIVIEDSMKAKIKAARAPIIKFVESLTSKGLPKYRAKLIQDIIEYRMGYVLSCQ